MKGEGVGGMAGDKGVVVGGDDDRGAEAVHFVEELHEAAGLGVVEVAGGFVGQQQGGAAHDGAGDGDALLLATRELGGALVELAGEADPAEKFVDVGADLAFGAAFKAKRQSDVVVGGQVGEKAEVLENHADAAAQEGKAAAAGGADGFTEEDEVALGGTDGEVKEAEKGGLARAGGAEQPAEPAFRDGEGDVVQDFVAAAARPVAQPDRLQIDHACCLRPGCVSVPAWLLCHDGAGDGKRRCAASWGGVERVASVALGGYHGTMRIACPECNVGYEVPGAQLAPGREVRCVRCGCIWTPVATVDAVPEIRPEPEVEPKLGRGEVLAGLPPEPIAEPPPDVHDAETSVDLAVPLVAAPEVGEPIYKVSAPARRRLPVVVGWLLTLLVVGEAAYAAAAYPRAIMRAWPPAERVYALFHVAPGDAPEGAAKKP